MPTPLSTPRGKTDEGRISTERKEITKNQWQTGLRKKAEWKGGAKGQKKKKTGGKPAKKKCTLELGMGVGRYDDIGSEPSRRGESQEDPTDCTEV